MQLNLSSSKPELQCMFLAVTTACLYYSVEVGVATLLVSSQVTKSGNEMHEKKTWSGHCGKLIILTKTIRITQ